ncbi:MAG TPA: hypothetical protein VEK86_01780 [Gemmatimonadales bacterium]|nr:hypothetical protein [Gemmatimonadales bacterium]
MKQPASLRVRRSVIVLIVAGWIAATVWTPSDASAAPGDVLRSWVASGVTIPFGVGYTSRLWISNVPDPDLDYEFTSDGAATGRAWPASWVGSWAADMAYLPGPKLLCQVNVGGDKGIYCWNPETGAVAGSIVGAFPWTATSQRGLAYRAADDTFYIGGWNEGIIYRIKGLSYPDKGAVVSQCYSADPKISGLAYNAVFNVLWLATNSDTDTIYALNPDTCTIITTLGNNGTLPHPDPGFNGAGLEMDENGNLWMVSQGSAKAFLVVSGLPISTPPPPPPPDPVPTPDPTLPVATLRDVPPGAFRNPGLQRAFAARVNDIMRFWPRDPALQMLQNLRMRTDGCGAAADQDDWIVCDYQSAVRTKIDTMIGDLTKKRGR